MTRSLFALLLLLSTVSAAPPNIVLIYADDLGYGDISCNGATAVETPNIDRIAKEGINLRAGYCTASTCTPSRFSLLTGKYAFRQAGTNILPGDAKLVIDPAEPTLPSVLRAAGYRTGVVGKWHLGLGGEAGIDWNKPISPGPNEVGFDFSHIMAATGDRVPCVYVEDGKVVDLDPADPIQVSYQHGFEGLPDGIKDRSSLRMDWVHGHNNAVLNGIGRIGFMKGGKSAVWKDEDMADHFTRQALRFIRETEGRPFFLYFALHDIHVPRVPHPRFAGKTKMGPRGDAIVQADWQTGEILRLLDEMGIAENTLVIFSSDNGPVVNDGYVDDSVKLLGDHKPAGPLNGGKYTALEGGTRVPFLIRWPARVKAGYSSDAPVSQIDFARTFAGLAGKDPGGDAFPDSLDTLPVFLGESDEGRGEIVQQGSSLALRAGDWKIILAKKEGGRPQLYNLAGDPGEKADIAAEHPEKVKELAGRLRRIRDGSR